MNPGISYELDKTFLHKGSIVWVPSKSEDAGRGIRTPACECTDAILYKISRRPPYQAWLSRQIDFVTRPNIVSR